MLRWTAKYEIGRLTQTESGQENKTLAVVHENCMEFVNSFVFERGWYLALFAQKRDVFFPSIYPVLLDATRPIHT